jgi:gliding motility-associated-like protein
MFACFTASGEHIVGGEIFYECLGDGEYLVTMKLYRDCAGDGAPFDNPASFSVFNESNILVENFSVFIDQFGAIDANLNSPCLAIPPDVCLQEGIYEFNYTVPDPTQTYQIVYQRCCRNQTIQNLELPGEQGISIVANIPGFSDGSCNSKASFNNFPPPVLCAQETLVFDHSATDLDGDSLAYSLCAPFLGGSIADPAPGVASPPPYPQVVWAAGYDAGSPLNGNPGLSIDVNTGLLTGVPTQLGQFVVGVCVEEWRDGVLLTTNTRDFQFNVAFCEESSAAIIGEPDPEDLCESLFVQFENLSDSDNDFVWDFGDPSTDADFSFDFDGAWTYPEPGLYTVSLITNPGFFCSDTATIEIPLFNPEIEVEVADFECVDDQQVFNFSAVGIFSSDDVSVQWDFGENADPQTATGLTTSGITFSSLGNQNVTVQVQDNACSAENSVTINIPGPPEIVIDPQEAFCDGFTYEFTHSSTNASNFFWDFGVINSVQDVSDEEFPTFTFPGPGVYTITLTGSEPFNCPSSATAVFEIESLLAPEIEDNPVACFEDNAVDFFASGSYSSEAVFDWSFEGAMQQNSTVENPVGINYLAPGTYPVTLTISENGCTRTAENTMTIHQNPSAVFSPNILSGCAPLSVRFFNESFTESTSVTYTWDFGDGNTSFLDQTLHTFEEPGEYLVSLQMENLNGCIDSDSYTLETLINVSPSPTAGFIIDPRVVSVLNPEITLTDQSEGSISCSYFFDGQEFENCNITHDLENFEPQVITQTVVNEFGCTDQAQGEIFVSDHRIYIPNAFTPDGDGLNDLFMPVGQGIVNLSMQIFDRWGNMVYFSENETRGWDGASPSQEYYAGSNVFNYLIVVTDYSGANFEYSGSLNLIR